MAKTQKGFYKSIKYNSLEGAMGQLDISELPNLIEIVKEKNDPLLAGLIVEFGDVEKSSTRKINAIKRQVRNLSEFLSQEYVVSPSFAPLDTDLLGDYNFTRYYAIIEKRVK